jgi:hypothetical protein
VVLGQLDRRARADEHVGELREDHRHGGLVEGGLGRVGAVVQADAQDLLGIGHRRAQAGVGRGHDGVAVGAVGERARRLVQSGATLRILRDDGAHARPIDPVVQAATPRGRRGVDEPSAEHAHCRGPAPVALVGRQAQGLGGGAHPNSEGLLPSVRPI